MSTITPRTRTAASMRIARAFSAAQQKHLAACPGKPFTIGLAADVLGVLLAEEFPSLKKRATVDGRDPLFDALAGACGYDGQLTKTAGALVGVALREILAVSPDVTPEEITRVAKVVRKRFENCGPRAVAGHWHEFAKRSDAPKRDIYKDPSGDWRTVALRLHPQAMEWITPHDFARMEWSEINLNLRADILKNLAP